MSSFYHGICTGRLLVMRVADVFFGTVAQIYLFRLLVLWLKCVGAKKRVLDSLTLDDSYVPSHGAWVTFVLR